MNKKENPYRLYLTEDQMPKQYYNLRADMKELPDPMLNPITKKEATLEDLLPVFCKELAKQELDNKTRYVDIPKDWLKGGKKYYGLRISGDSMAPKYNESDNLEKYLDTPAKIYYKFEGNNTSGSHKLNSAIAQVYYAKQEGVKHLTTETGAGQWGTALSEACSYFNIPLSVYMVKASYEQKPFRKDIMRTFGANVIASPSNTTSVGRKILEEHPNTTGSLGCAISEAVEKAVSTPNSKYVLGSVLNQVLLHQSIIGLECETAFKILNDYPDIIIGCAGGGSNLGGLIAPFMRDKIKEKHNSKIIAVEPASCPSLTRGKYTYDYCDTGKMTPLAKMYTLGCDFIPAPNHAGGLRYHGMSPIISKLYHDGYIEAVSTKQTDVFKAAILFAKIETILPAPESSHAIKVAIDEALKCKETGKEKTILFGLTGTGYFDMTAYSSYLDKTMSDYIPTDEELLMARDCKEIVENLKK